MPKPKVNFMCLQQTDKITFRIKYTSATHKVEMIYFFLT